jgi:hypothetical protein
MTLSATNGLSLFKSDGSAAGITLDPNAGAITLGGLNSGIFFGTNTTPTLKAASNGSAIFPNSVTLQGASGVLRLEGTTTSTSPTTGALTVAGGLGVGKDSWINGIRIGRGNSDISTNTAVGTGTLSFNSSGWENSASGMQALSANTTGYRNSAFGSQALFTNSSGWENTAAGSHALRLNLTGAANTATGSYALTSSTTGHFNAAYGSTAMMQNTTGSNNSAFGGSALRFNTTGGNNTAAGPSALHSNTTGSSNVAVGSSAGRYHANGSTALTDPESSVYLGANSRGKDNNDNNSIVIGANAIGQGANTTVIGTTATTSTRIFGNLVAGTGLGSPVLTQAQASTSYLAANPPSIRGTGATLSNGGLIAMGNFAQATSSKSVAIGDYAVAAAGGSLALGYLSRCSESAYNSVALGGGIVTKGSSLAVAYGEANGELSLAFGLGVTTGDSSIALGGYDYEWGNWPTNQSIGASSTTIGGVGNMAAGFSSFSSGFWTKAASFGSVSLGSLNLGTGSTANEWVETDSLFELGNGNSQRSWSEPPASNRSNAITTLKNGQTTLTNKAWKENPAVAPTTSNSNGEALVVEGHTRLKGKVIIEQPQGDISMGIYQ